MEKIKLVKAKLIKVTLTDTIGIHWTKLFKLLNKECQKRGCRHLGDDYKDRKVINMYFTCGITFEAFLVRNVIKYQYITKKISSAYNV